MTNAVLDVGTDVASDGTPYPPRDVSAGGMEGSVITIVESVGAAIGEDIESHPGLLELEAGSTVVRPPNEDVPPTVVNPTVTQPVQLVGTSLALMVMTDGLTAEGVFPPTDDDALSGGVRVAHVDDGTEGPKLDISGGGVQMELMPGFDPHGSEVSTADDGEPLQEKLKGIGGSVNVRTDSLEIVDDAGGRGIVGHIVISGGPKSVEDAAGVGVVGHTSDGTDVVGQRVISDGTAPVDGPAAASLPGWKDGANGRGFRVVWTTLEEEAPEPSKMV